MENLEKKSDIVVWLNHMANILGPLILFWILVTVWLWNLLPMFNFDKSISNLIQTTVLFVILLIYIYKAWKYINWKFEYQNPKNVVYTSMLSFFLINIIYIWWMIFMLLSFSTNQTDKSTFDFFLETTGFNNIISIIIYIVFYSLYYKLSLKGLEK